MSLLPFLDPQAVAIQATQLGVSPDLFRRARTARSATLTPAEQAKWQGFQDTLRALANMEGLERLLPTLTPSVVLEIYRAAVVNVRQLELFLGVPGSKDPVVRLFVQELLLRLRRIHVTARGAIELARGFRSTEELSDTAAADIEQVKTQFLDPSAPLPTQASLLGDLAILEGALTRAETRYQAARAQLGPTPAAALQDVDPNHLFQVERSWFELRRTRQRLAIRRTIVEHYDEWVRRRERVSLVSPATAPSVRPILPSDSAPELVEPQRFPVETVTPARR